MTTEVEAHNQEILRKLDEKQKIFEFAKSLGCDDQQAKVFGMACGEYLEWTGARLMFKGAAGKTVAIDDPNCRAFFEREYPFLVPTPTSEGQQAAIDPELLAKAAAGNKTAEGAICRALNDDVAATEKLIAAERAKATSGDDKEFEEFKRWKASRSDGAGKSSTNPFIGLRDKSGRIVPEQMKKVASLIRAVGTAKSAAIAKSAGLRLDGSSIPERYQ